MGQQLIRRNGDGWENFIQIQDGYMPVPPIEYRDIAIFVKFIYCFTKIECSNSQFSEAQTYEITAKAQYAAEWPLDIKQIGDRVMLTLKLYDKINPETLTYDTHFFNDIGLDSLDLVEVMLMIEDEFGFEIPDEHGERLLTPRKLVQYICDHEDVFE